MKVVKWLVLEGKADVNKASDSGNTQLFVAAHNGHLEVVEWLVGGAQADVNKALVVNGMTPLLVAARACQYEVFQWLVQVGKANINQASRKGTTPFKYYWPYYVTTCGAASLAVPHYLLSVGARVFSLGDPGRFQRHCEGLDSLESAETGGTNSQVCPTL
jgi:hypothetical protein